MKLFSAFLLSILLGISAIHAQNCDADFYYADQGNGTYAFFDSSFVTQLPGISVSYQWDFGDGNIDTVQHPNHTYNSPGSYTVCLIITASGTGTGCTDSICQVITYAGASGCNADFQIAGGQGGTFQFVNYSSPLNGLFYWDFGDGNTSTAVDPTHTYTASGTYDVCLVVDASTPIGGPCLDTTCQTITVVVGNPNCTASFIASADSSGFGFTFQDNSVGGGFLTSYLWDFGDGNTGSGSIVNHFYSAPGLYLVCLTISDSTSGCFDTYCDSIVVGSGNIYCDANFSITDLQQGSYQFNNLSSGTSLQYQWWFGDGNFSSATNPTHTYAANGTYDVCLVVLGSSPTGGCDDTLCIPLVVTGVGGNPTNCNADFTYSVNGSTVDFVDLSTGGMISHTWDFGDGSMDSSANPTHTYNSSGFYQVCLTIVSSTVAGVCTSTYCDTLSINAAPQGLSITGPAYVSTGSGSVINDGVAYLIVHDSAAGTLTLVDTSDILFSSYTFNNVAPGTYLIKAALRPTSPYYAGHLPTYLGDELFWNNATSTIATNSNIINPAINLVVGNNPGGPGFIGGLISQGANKQGDPIPNISVLLMDEFDNPVTHTLSATDGSYDFPNLAYGTYKIYLEIAGKYGDPIIVTISANEPSTEVNDFLVDEDSWASEASITAIDPFDLGTIVRVYPNPANEQLNLEVDLQTQGQLNLSIVDMLGSTVYRQAESGFSGNQTFKIPVSELPTGTYLLHIQSGNQQSFHRFVKAD